MDPISFIIHYWFLAGLISAVIIFLLVFTLASDELGRKMNEVEEKAGRPVDAGRIYFFFFIILCALGFISVGILIRMILGSIFPPPTEE